MDQSTSTTPPSAIAAESTQDIPSSRVSSENDLAFQPTGFPFMDLPKELRLKVYDVVATHTICRPLLTSRHSLYYDMPDLGLLCTSRSIRNEAHMIIQKGDDSASPTFTVQPSPCRNWYDMPDPLTNAIRVLERVDIGVCGSCYEKDDKLASCPNVFDHIAMSDTYIYGFLIDFGSSPVYTKSTINQFYHRTHAALCRGKPLSIRVVLPPVEDSYKEVFMNGSRGGRLWGLFLEYMCSLQMLFPKQGVKFVLLVHSNSAERWATKLSAPNRLPERLNDGTWQVELLSLEDHLVQSEIVERRDSFSAEGESLRELKLLGLEGGKR